LLARDQARATVDESDCKPRLVELPDRDAGDFFIGIIFLLALLSVWISLLVFVLSFTMAFYRPAFTDLTVVLVLWFGSPLALCLSGLVLWAYRKDTSGDRAIAAQRTQAKVAIGLALAATAIVYALIIFSTKLEPN
jgi:hypothetical protein